MQQPDLFSAASTFATISEEAQARPRFFGPDVTPADEVRLGKQLAAVKAVMADGSWRTLREIADAVRCGEASVSARLRDLRRAGLTVECKRVQPTGGLRHYRVTEGR